MENANQICVINLPFLQVFQNFKGYINLKLSGIPLILKADFIILQKKKGKARKLSAYPSEL